ncbi:MAG: envelope stress response membrane protein PspC [Deltaproteobacteria bacterium]|nr:envelope stress response membrane protein PspC [Deltaproteobacteria bacterium]
MKRDQYNVSGGIYRSRNGMILGVCRGIADYFDFSVFWVRAIMVTILLLSGFWPILILYIIAGLLMKSEPVMEAYAETGNNNDARSGTRANERIKRRFDGLERRIHRMEDCFTSREFDWERRLNT